MHTNKTKANVSYQDILKLVRKGPKTKNQIYMELCQKKRITLSRSTVWRLLRELEDMGKLKVEVFGKSHIVKLYDENYEKLFIAKFLAALLMLLDPIQAETIIEFYNELSIKHNLKLPNLRNLQYENEVKNLANKMLLAIQNKITS